MQSPSFQFGSCPTPGGSQIATYSSGQHWIPGNAQLQWGSDLVFSKGNNSYTQCFCPLTRDNQLTGAMGTQTNWLFASSLDSITQQQLLSNGWIVVPDGSAFGLSPGRYLAQNTSFSCNNSTTQIITGNATNTTTITNNVNTNTLTMQQMQNHLFHIIISDNGALSINHVNF
jgi:hypothetical protein